MTGLEIGIIGLDTSHALAFTKLLNDRSHPFNVKGGKVTFAFPGGSPDFELSLSRVGKFTRDLRENYSVQMVRTKEELAEKSDAILLESVDGAVHLEQLKSIVAYKKPVFIDKPFSLDSKVAMEMLQMAENYGTPVMSSSALRFAEGLTKILQENVGRQIIGADCFGPMEMINREQGYFWYGIHMADMLYAILGPGATSVSAISNEQHDILTGLWNDGRLGTIRGNRKGNNLFGAIIHFEDGSEFLTVRPDDKPYYASLLEHIIDFFGSGIPSVPLHETAEIIRFLEVANESDKAGKPIFL